MSAGHRAVTEDNLLEISRSQCIQGEWDNLVKLTHDRISHHPDRAMLSVFAAAGHQQLGNIQETRQCMLQAMDWGCNKAQMGRVLISGVHNILGRCAAALCDESRMSKHFEHALDFSSDPNRDAISRSRSIREISRLGLLADAVKSLKERISTLKPEVHQPSQIQAQINILHTEIGLLQHELLIAQRRGQLRPTIPQEERSAVTLEESIKMWRTALQQRAVSQLGQDLWVLEKSNYKRGGYFVEFGATNGILLSNTYLLEKEFGWRGLCAEPNLQFFDELKKNRQCTLSNACIGGQTGEKVEFIFADVYGGMTRDAEGDEHKDKRKAYQTAGFSAELITVSLNDFLTSNNAPKNIDYLSIDTEGSEYSILETFPFSNWNIKLITVEHNFTEQRIKIRKLLESNGYTCREAQWDDWYEKKKNSP